jgi:tRNA threonylcarbamoyladenosine biosynthesis protein TsaE
MNYEINSLSSEFSQEIGEKLGKNLKGNELIILVSDLGGGKTTITKGIVRGVGSLDLVSSPSFTLSNVYKAQDFEIVHYDFYRLNNPGVLLQGIIEDINDDKKIVIVEWADIVIKQLIGNKVVISIESLSENTRKIKLAVDNDLKYVLEGLG